jgi:hypothetical protein
MNLHRRIQHRSLLAQGEGTRTKFQTLMEERMAGVIVISIMLGLIVNITTPGCRELLRTSVSGKHWHHSKFALVRLVLPLRLAALSLCITMPRIRGTPRRGAAWHAAQSRRKRKADFEKALAVATRRRRMRGMAIVEEVIPDEGMESPPAHTLFMVPENWNPRSHFGLDSTPGMASGTSNHGDNSKEEPYPPCYVEEEVPPEPTEAETGDKEHGATADTSQAQPPSVDGGYLNLIFDVRNLLEDQTFRIVRLEQRLDMFFAAHSRATPKKQCPTCARAYAFPARWRHTVDDDTHHGSEVT